MSRYLTRKLLLLPWTGAVALLLVFPTGLDADLVPFRASSRTMSLFVLPGETVTFDLAGYAGRPASRIARFTVESEVDVRHEEGSGFVMTAPGRVGVYPVMLREPADPGRPPSPPYRIQLVVMRPATEVENGMLDGYPVGAFPEDHAGERWRFERPRGFVEITEANRATPLSDHFTIGDLDCKLDVPYPHYAAIRTSLLVKLEALSQTLLERGLPGHHLVIMSGFRTPEYNRSIGNRTVYSRHIAGDAADVFIDADGDERMDDLDGDGRVNRRDSRFLLAIVNSMDQSVEFGPLVGGAAAYRANRDHGPFVHVDTRGYPARW